MGVELPLPTHSGQQAVGSDSSVARCSPQDRSNAEDSISPQRTVITGGEILKVTFTARGIRCRDSKRVCDTLCLNKMPLNHTHMLHKAGVVRNPNPGEISLHSH